MNVNINWYRFASTLGRHQDLEIFDRKCVNIFHLKSVKMPKKPMNLQLKGLSFSIVQHSPLFEGMTLYSNKVDMMVLGPEAHNNWYHGCGFVESECEVTGQLRCLAAQDTIDKMMQPKKKY